MKRTAIDVSCLARERARGVTSIAGLSREATFRSVAMPLRILRLRGERK